MQIYVVKFKSFKSVIRLYPLEQISKIRKSRVMFIQDSKVVYDRNHLFGLGSDTETETENWPKLLTDTETNQNHKILNWKALYQEVCKRSARNFHVMSTTKTFMQHTTNRHHVNQL